MEWSFRLLQRYNALRHKEAVTAPGVARGYCAKVNKRFILTARR
jgi:hypothetical protein